MGLLRLYLALCVVGAHAGPVLPWATHDGIQAVQIFFLISGFYMALVLSSGRYSSSYEFYLSRFLRIFPVTWLVLAGIVAASLVLGLSTNRWFALTPYFAEPFAKNGTLGVALAAVSNFTLFGQDWVMFLSDESGESLRLTKNFWQNKFPLWHLLLIPPAWSVSLELWFYLIAPIVNRLLTKTIVAIIVALLLTRLLAYVFLELSHDPWTYRFFLFELSNFFLGMLAFRLYDSRLKTLATKSSPTFVAFLITSLVSLALFSFGAEVVAVCAKRFNGAYCSLASYPVWCIVIVCLFAASRNNKYDRMIGELSFPIYLVHFFVISVVGVAIRVTGTPASSLGPLSALVSIIAASLLFKWCIAPMERVRHDLTNAGKQRS